MAKIVVLPDDGIGKHLKLPYCTVTGRTIVVSCHGAVIQLQPNFSHQTGLKHGTNHALCSLNQTAAAAFAILGRHTDRGKTGVGHGQNAGCIDSSVHIRQELHRFRHTKKTHHEEKIVNTQIQQRAAGLFGIKNGMDFSSHKCIVPAGILTKLALDQLDLSNSGQ